MRIARDAGISQPYLFRLFRTKRELFLACQQRSHDRIRQTFEAASEGLPQDQRLEAMGHAYVGLLADRTALLFQMQSYAACSDPEIQAHVREAYSDLVALVTRAVGRRAARGVAVLLVRHAAQRDRVARPPGDRRRGRVGQGLVRPVRADDRRAGRELRRRHGARAGRAGPLARPCARALVGRPRSERRLRRRVGGARGGGGRRAPAALADDPVPRGARSRPGRRDRHGRARRLQHQRGQRADRA